MGAEGEGGCQRYDQFLRTTVLIGCVKSVQEGGRGSKIPKILRTYLMDAPKLIFLCAAVLHSFFYAFAVLPSYLIRRFIGSRDFGMTWKS